MRLIIADDHALFRDSLENLLTSNGHEVVGVASNGRQAYDLTRRYRPDVVLMDLGMPELDGLSATKLISADAQLDAVKVVVLTASTDDTDLFEAIRSGAEGLPGQGPRLGQLPAPARRGGPRRARAHPAAGQEAAHRVRPSEGRAGPRQRPGRA